MPNVDPGADLEATLVPATDLQERLWLAQRLATDQPLYQMPIHLSLHGPLDVEALHVAFARCVARHEALRTAFDTFEGRLHQVIVDPPGPRVSIPVIDLSGEQPGGRRARRRELAERQHTIPWTPPSCRCCALTRRPGRAAVRAAPDRAPHRLRRRLRRAADR